ncbi:hypothetical protein KSP40_PGU019436 [Platanthera guangdongensis]|uniref:Uncharacterized protein n=1 Tax=Platanthera guangdongensis TaxID=2320717 RepID=A0ABR2MRZ5_9ASPA
MNGDHDDDASSTDSSIAYSSYDSELSSLSTASPASERRGSREIFRKSKLFASAEAGEQGKKRFSRFWGKIMMAGGGRRKERGEELPHLKSIKEKGSSRWTFFS